MIGMQPVLDVSLSVGGNSYSDRLRDSVLTAIVEQPAELGRGDFAGSQQYRSLLDQLERHLQVKGGSRHLPLQAVAARWQPQAEQCLRIATCPPSSHLSKLPCLLAAKALPYLLPEVSRPGPGRQ